MNRFSVKLCVLLILQLFGLSNAWSQRADRYELTPPPKSGFLSNTAIDIIEHNGAIWMASSKGVNYTNNNGLSWLYFDTSNGLVSNNVSAIASIGSRLWVGTNHTEALEDQMVSASDGPSYTDNDGLTWINVDFSPSGQDIRFVTGGNRSIFDITGITDELEGANNDWVFFTAFAGGLLASRDGGINWRRIYPSAADSLQFNAGGPPSLRNRYFSAVVDTSHGDSLFLFTGTAGGIFQYVYTPRREKLYAVGFRSISVCTGCSDSSRAFFGGRGGVAVGRRTGGPFFTRFSGVDGLPAGSGVSALQSYGDRVIVGTRDSVTGVGSGLFVSLDLGDSYAPVGTQPPTGAGNAVTDFTPFGGRLYLAAGEAGLWVTTDSGSNWTNVFVGPSEMNDVNALDTADDRLYVGTDSGFVALYLSGTGTVDSSYSFVFAEDDSTSRRVIQLETQPIDVIDTFVVGVDTIVDTLNPLWTVNHPATGIGQPMVSESFDGGRSWTLRSEGFYLDVGFVDTLAFLTEYGGVRRTSFRLNAPLTGLTVNDSLNSSINFNGDSVFTAKGFGDTLILGSSSGLAFSTNRGSKYKIYRPNFDTLAADFVVNYTILNTLFNIPGDFIPALAIQEHPDTLAHVWASGRPVDLGGDGIARARYILDTTIIVDTAGDSTILIDPAPRLRWSVVYEDGFAWNFTFDGDTAFAATDAGLLRYVETRTGSKWDTVQFIDDSQGIPLINPGTPVYAVRVVNNFLWVGTDDGVIRIDLGDPSLQDQRLFARVDSTTGPDQVYAYPVPFSPGRGGVVDFRFVVEQDGPVTIEVYDYAMNLVARPVNSVFYAAGIYPSGSSQGRTWDGRNERGDVIAVGVYYFKVETSGGTVRWGKLAVMP